MEAGRAVPTRRPPAPLPVFAGLLLLLLLAALAGTILGSVKLPPGQVGRALLGLPVATVTRTIVLAIRLPRVVLGALVGAGLALSGAVLQGLFRNPLADPGLIGVSSGAAFGAVLAIALGVSARGLWILPLWAFCGALAAAAAVYLLAGRRTVLTLILAGVAVSALFGAASTLVLVLNIGNTDVQAMLGWLYGSLDGALWRQDLVLAAFVLPGGVLMGLFARELNLLATGEEGAAALGVPVEATQRVLLLLAALVTAAAVAASGTIGFVGLMVPHLLRRVVGADHRLLLPACLLGGAAFLVLADLLARVVAAPAEINLGVVTAVLGVPFFLYLLRRRGGA